MLGEHQANNGYHTRVTGLHKSARAAHVGNMSATGSEGGVSFVHEGRSDSQVPASCAGPAGPA